jgi:hypothetical protein
MIQSISRRGFGAALALLVVTTAPACNMTKDRKAAEREVVDFHRQLDAGNFAGLYSASHGSLKKVATEKDFVALLDAVHRKLGSVVSTTPAGANVLSGTNGTTVKLGYQTKFSGGDGVETFVYFIEGGRPLLAGYNMNSMALITK